MTKVSRAHTAYEFIVKTGLHTAQSDISLLALVGHAYEVEGNVSAQRAILAAQVNNLFELLTDIEHADFHAEILSKYVAAITEMQTFISLPFWNSSPKQHQSNFANIRVQLLTMQSTLSHTAPLHEADKSKYEEASTTLQNLLIELKELDSSCEIEKDKLVRQIELIIIFLNNANSMPLADALDLCASAFFRTQIFENKSGAKEISKKIMVGLYLAICGIGSFDQGLGTLKKIKDWSIVNLISKDSSDKENDDSHEDPAGILPDIIKPQQPNQKKE